MKKKPSTDEKQSETCLDHVISPEKLRTSWSMEVVCWEKSEIYEFNILNENLEYFQPLNFVIFVITC